MEKPVQIFICTPAYGGLCHNRYVTGLLDSLQVLCKFNIFISIYFIENESLIQRARNRCVAEFMSRDDDYLLFIDADISFKALDIYKLVKMSHDMKSRLVGGLYCKKKYDWDYLNVIEKWIKNKEFEHNKDKPNGQFVREMLCRSNFIPLDKTSLIDNRYLYVKYLATGFMMIDRSIFTDLIKKCPEFKYEDNSGIKNDKIKDYFYTFFDCCIDPETKHYLSEDFYFCKLVKDKLGINPLVDLDINLGHNGTCEFRGDLRTAMQLEKKEI